MRESLVVEATEVDVEVLMLSTELLYSTSLRSNLDLKSSNKSRVRAATSFGAKYLENGWR